MKTPLAFALIIALLTDSPSLPPPGPEQEAKARQAGKLSLAGNMNRIKDMVQARTIPYDQQAVARSARAIAALANADPGSPHGREAEPAAAERIVPTRPQWLRQSREYQDLARTFAAEANELARVAALDDQAAIRNQLDRTNKTCQHCHEKFRDKA